MYTFANPIYFPVHSACWCVPISNVLSDFPIYLSSRDLCYAIDDDLVNDHVALRPAAVTSNEIVNCVHADVNIDIC